MSTACFIISILIAMAGMICWSHSKMQAINAEQQRLTAEFKKSTSALRARVDTFLVTPQEEAEAQIETALELIDEGLTTDYVINAVFRPHDEYERGICRDVLWAAAERRGRQRRRDGGMQHVFEQMWGIQERLRLARQRERDQREALEQQRAEESRADTRRPRLLRFRKEEVDDPSPQT